MVEFCIQTSDAASRMPPATAPKFKPAKPLKDAVKG